MSLSEGVEEIAVYNDVAVGDVDVNVDSAVLTADDINVKGCAGTLSVGSLIVNDIALPMDTISCSESISAVMRIGRHFQDTILEHMASVIHMTLNLARGASSVN